MYHIDELQDPAGFHTVDCGDSTLLATIPGTAIEAGTVYGMLPSVVFTR